MFSVEHASSTGSSCNGGGEEGGPEGRREGLFGGGEGLFRGGEEGGLFTSCGISTSTV